MLRIFKFISSWFILQDQYEEIDAVYTEEKKQLNEIEERFKTLEVEYDQVSYRRCKTLYILYTFLSFTCELCFRSWRSDAWLENVAKPPSVT